LNKEQTWRLLTVALVFWEEKPGFFNKGLKQCNHSEIYSRGVAPPGGKKPPATVIGRLWILWRILQLVPERVYRKK